MGNGHTPRYFRKRHQNDIDFQKRHENDTPTPFKIWRHLDPKNDTKCRKRHDLVTLVRSVRFDLASLEELG